MQLYFLISGSINAATDFALLALVSGRHDRFSTYGQETDQRSMVQPIPMLWRLRTSQPQKLVLTGIFTVGLT